MNDSRHQEQLDSPSTDEVVKYMQYKNELGEYKLAVHPQVAAEQAQSNQSASELSTEPSANLEASQKTYANQAEHERVARDSVDEAQPISAEEFDV